MTHPPVDVDAGQRAAWRREVGELRAREQRRRHPLGLHLGEPAGWRESVELAWPEPRWHDSGLRTELVIGLLSRTGPEVGSAYGWITRPGVSEPHDVDLAWYAAALRGFGAHGLELRGFFTVTRTGWLDVASGERRSWKRLRLGTSARGARVRHLAPP